MNILEKEIEELIFEALVENPELLSEKGLEFEPQRLYERQPDLGVYGRLDIVGYTVQKKYRGFRPIDVTVFEFKKDNIDVNTLMQAARYRAAISHFVKQLGISHVLHRIDIILIGKHMQLHGDFVYTLDLCPHKVAAYTYKLSLTEGLTFERHMGYTQPNPGFKKTYQYSFRGVKDFLEYHNPSLVSYPMSEI